MFAAHRSSSREFTMIGVSTRRLVQSRGSLCFRPNVPMCTIFLLLLLLLSFLFWTTDPDGRKEGNLKLWIQTPPPATKTEDGEKERWLTDVTLVEEPWLANKDKDKEPWLADKTQVRLWIGRKWLIGLKTIFTGSGSGSGSWSTKKYLWFLITFPFQMR